MCVEENILQENTWLLPKERGKEEGRKDDHKIRERRNKKKRRKEENGKKGKERKVYQMVSASLFLIAAKVAGRFLETAELVP